jgi:hypothetical protein
MDGFLIVLVTIGVTIFFVLGVPIFLVIGFWVVGVSVIIDFTLANVGVTLYEGLNFFGLLALPLFILTGDLINAAGIAKRLSDFAYSVLGWLHGGLAMASLGACGLFAAISGSNSATTATIGSIMYPEMTKGGYDKHFAAATVAAGGTVGIIIPPSIIFIVYGFLMNLSISDLFIGGLIPGVLMVVAMQATCYWVARRNGWGHLISFDPARIAKAGVNAWLGFLAIFIVIWGIYSGIFSPTEAAGVTAGFCLLAGLFITRQIRLRALPDVLLRSGQITDHRAAGTADCRLGGRAADPLPARRQGRRDRDPGRPGRLLPDPFRLHGAGAGRRDDPREPAEHHHPGADPGADRGQHRRRSDPLRGGLPGRRRHRIHHPALRPQSLCRQRHHGDSLSAPVALHRALPAGAIARLADHRHRAAALHGPPGPRGRRHFPADKLR